MVGVLSWINLQFPSSKFLKIPAWCLRCKIKKKCNKKNQSSNFVLINIFEEIMNIRRILLRDKGVRGDIGAEEQGETGSETVPLPKLE